MQVQLKIMHLLRKVGTHVVSSGNLSFSLCLFKFFFWQYISNKFEEAFE